jgi:hypothetical protein
MVATLRRPTVSLRAGTDDAGAAVADELPSRASAEGVESRRRGNRSIQAVTESA